MVSPPQRLTVKAGTQLFREGESAGAAYLILNGTVELFLIRGTVRRQLAIRRTNDLFGERALAGEGPRRSSAVALSDCELLVITREHISRRIETIDPLLRFCLGALLDRYGQATETAAVAGEQQSSAAAPTSVWTRHVAAARDILTFEHELRGGLERGEFDVHYQPIVELHSRRLAGFEALVRWRHPRRGMLPPNEFIPFAEATGVISDVTTFCVREVAAAFPTLREAGRRNGATAPLFISVNVSGMDLMRPAFAADTVSILCDSGVEPEDIRIEVTESILMADAERCAETLNRCRDQGFKIAIDDFGTGYSSLNYLNTLPVSVLKMDRSFTFSMLDGAAGRKIIGAILQLGIELGLSVIAEGIEDEAQAAMLQSMGCTLGQGYLFGRALDRRDTLRLIEQWRLPSLAERRIALSA
jgi:EAL domain-containing protein (putative c-di-GMP-specific phosphodiesterase class I)